MRAMRICGAVVVAVLAGFAWQGHAEDRTVPLAAQGSSSAPPTIQVYSRETLVDVTVTDDKGQPVRGLTRADFIVEEDGKEQAIRGFEEFGKEMRVAAPAAAAAAPKLAANVYSNRQAAPLAGPLNVVMLGNINWSECVYAKRAIVAYVKDMPAGTQVALFVEGRLVQGFTSDAEVLIAAMNADPQIRSCLLRQIPVEQLSDMRAIAAYVAGDKGKKNLIWFTHGIPEVTDPQFSGTLRDRLPDPTPELHHTYGLLAAAQVTVFPVDASSIVVVGIGSVANDLSKIDVNTGAAVAGHLMGALNYNAGSHLSMEAVAESTGGAAFYNTNDLRGAMARAIDEGSSYYTLSYVPPGEKYDGRHHTIQVKVDQPGVQLVYRDEYYAEDPRQNGHEPPQVTMAAAIAKPDKDAMKASMARFAPVATEVVFDVKVAPTQTRPGPTDAAVMGFPAAEVKGKPMVRYDVLYSVPTDEIGFTDGPDGVYRSSLEFDVVASDVSGKLITSVSRSLPLALSVDEYAEFVKTPFKFYQQIDLPAGMMFVRVGVLDRMSKKVGTVEVPLTVTKGAVEAAR